MWMQRACIRVVVTLACGCTSWRRWTSWVLGLWKRGRGGARIAPGLFASSSSSPSSSPSYLLLLLWLFSSLRLCFFLISSSLPTRLCSSSLDFLLPHRHFGLYLFVFEPRRSHAPFFLPRTYKHYALFLFRLVLFPPERSTTGFFLSLCCLRYVQTLSVLQARISRIRSRERSDDVETLMLLGHTRNSRELKEITRWAHPRLVYARLSFRDTRGANYGEEGELVPSFSSFRLSFSSLPFDLTLPPDTPALQLYKREKVSLRNPCNG